MLTVYHLGVSQSERIVWLCEELEIPYELVRFDRDPATQSAPPEYKALHPFGTAPVIRDGDVLLGETGAIIDYIVLKYGEGRLIVLPDSPDFPQMLYWYHFANASLMPARMIEIVAMRMGAESTGEAGNQLRARSDKAMAMIERRLGEAPYFGGDAFSVADIMMVFPLTTLRLFAPVDYAPFPNLRAYLARIGERPAYKRAMEKGDPGLTVPLA